MSSRAGSGNGASSARMPGSTCPCGLMMRQVPGVRVELAGDRPLRRARPGRAGRSAVGGHAGSACRSRSGCQAGRAGRATAHRRRRWPATRWRPARSAATARRRARSRCGPAGRLGRPPNRSAVIRASAPPWPLAGVPGHLDLVRAAPRTGSTRSADPALLGRGLGAVQRGALDRAGGGRARRGRSRPPRARAGRWLPLNMTR